MESPNITDIVFGTNAPTLDDPAETWFEASKFSRPTVWWDSAGVFLLESAPWLQEATVRAGKRFDHRPGRAMPEILPFDLSLDEAILRRRSRDDHDPSATLSDRELATLAWAGYGRTSDLAAGHARRTVPSGGALFPLDIYLAVARVDGFEPGRYHFDPIRRRFTLLGNDAVPALARATIQPESIEPASAVFVIAASFWRSRFKYGQRAMRFVCIEAGHVVQNMVLAATSLGLTHRPIGGFYDDEVADVIGLDGVNEAPLYLLPVGRPTVRGS